MEEKIKTRKLILLSCIGILLAICIVQLILAFRNPVKTLKLNEGFDSITVEKADGKITFLLDGSDWYVGTGDFKANSSDMNNITENLKEIKILDTIGRLSSEEQNGRYDLNENKAITVTASKNGKVLRTLKIGKASSTGSQTYVAVGNSKDINLVSGNLHSIFNKSEEDYRSKSVFSIKGSSISSVNVTMQKDTWSVSKSAPSEDTGASDAEATWTFSGTASSLEADTSKVNVWLGQISNCTAASWLDDSKALPAKKEASVEIDGTEGKITVDIYSEKDGERTKYIATSNKTAHKFELSESTAKRYIKNASELTK